MKTLTRNELNAMLEQHEDFLLINVLSEDAFRQAHIPGSYNIPAADKNFIHKVEQKAGSKDKKIVVYCASFDCSASPSAAKQLEQASFTQVYDYEGGTKDWKEGGYPVKGEG
ncbi:rhodanese-like domain-containing protein [Nitrosococcus wardiae]|uniref:Rhodanese-like domain-containing protein n=2 Tax=Nitrosococcus wardiae TaxID=1814290 RepID=A0A4P7C4B1_9GAMM|nr:rhodanese-like domain-containing protein [Nitrosococcus wardiae]